MTFESSKAGHNSINCIVDKKVAGSFGTKTDHNACLSNVDSVGQSLKDGSIAMDQGKEPNIDRLQQDETLRDTYVAFMEEYENAGHVCELGKKEASTCKLLSGSPSGRKTI